MNISTERLNLHDCNTRNSRNIEQHKLKLFEKKTSFIGVVFLFNLPNCILKEHNLRVKKILKDYLLKPPLYSFHKYLN